MGKLKFVWFLHDPFVSGLPRAQDTSIVKSLIPPQLPMWKFWVELLDGDVLGLCGFLGLLLSAPGRVSPGNSFPRVISGHPFVRDYYFEAPHPASGTPTFQVDGVNVNHASAHITFYLGGDHGHGPYQLLPADLSYRMPRGQAPSLVIANPGASVAQFSSKGAVLIRKSAPSYKGWYLLPALRAAFASAISDVYLLTARPASYDAAWSRSGSILSSAVYPPFIQIPSRNHLAAVLTWCQLVAPAPFPAFVPGHNEAEMFLPGDAREQGRESFVMGAPFENTMPLKDGAL